jgi:hypothetical protein
MLSKPVVIPASKAALLCYLAKSDIKIIFTKGIVGI